MRNDPIATRSNALRCNKNRAPKKMQVAESGKKRSNERFYVTDMESSTGAELFWDIVAELRSSDERIVEGKIMGGRCVRVGKEFLALVDFKDSRLVVKLPRERVDKLIAQGAGRPFDPAGKVFREWVSVAVPDRRFVRSPGSALRTCRLVSSASTSKAPASRPSRT